MAHPLTDGELLPLVEEPPRDEQVRLAEVALRADRGAARDAAVYGEAPARPDELLSGRSRSIVGERLVSTRASSSRRREPFAEMDPDEAR